MSILESLPPDSGPFRYRDGALHCEGVDLASLAEEHGTPLYVYSRASMAARYRRLRDAFGEDALICFAVKSNSNLRILQLFAEMGCGFDLVSGGELLRLQVAGVPTDRAVLAGVAKADWEIEAALEAGILLFNLESEHEVPMLAEIGGRLGRDVDVAVRLNVDVDAGTHEYISTGRKQDKFGLALDRAAVVVEQIAATPRLRLCGYHVHLGSLLRRTEPYLEALDRVLAFMDGAAVRREGVAYYDCGGGFGVRLGVADVSQDGAPEGVDGEGVLDVAALGAAMVPRLRERGLTPILEPGRFLVADAGVLITDVLGVKQSGDARFVLVDAAMNDLLRPALYGAEHPILPMREPAAGAVSEVCNIVGPVCESSDFLAKNRRLTPVRRGDRLAVLAAGAYGFSMACNYNSRRRPAEVLVDGTSAACIRSREDFADLWSREFPQ